MDQRATQSSAVLTVFHQAPDGTTVTRPALIGTGRSGSLHTGPSGTCGPDTGQSGSLDTGPSAACGPDRPGHRMVRLPSGTSTSACTTGATCRCTWGGFCLGRCVGLYQIFTCFLAGLVNTGTSVKPYVLICVYILYILYIYCKKLYKLTIIYEFMNRQRWMVRRLTH